MQKWEYICGQWSTKDPQNVPELPRLDTMLNKAGEDGWELVTVDTRPDGADNWTHFCVFKRPKP
jgi:hypothetical protein